MRALIVCVGAALSAIGSPAAADAPQLSLPIDCKVGISCFIQHYVDVDPGSGIKDYKCGAAAYNKHSGTDFRVRTLEDVKRGVRVLAAAPGTVSIVRDQLTDRIVRTAKDGIAVQNVFCGNAVVLDHGDGWKTRYCHMQKGSIQVRKGQKVERGQPLGLVGFSGFAQFPHVHLGVTKDGQKVDPFTGAESPEGCETNEAKGLWRADVRPQLNYRRGQLLAAGFSAGRVSKDSVIWRLPDNAEIASNSKALVSYAWLINVQEGDRVFTQLTGPKGIIASQTSKPMKRHRSQYVQYTGKQRPKGGWEAGLYVSEMSLIRDGKRVVQHREVLHMR